MEKEQGNPPVRTAETLEGSDGYVGSRRELLGREKVKDLVTEAPSTRGSAMTEKMRTCERPRMMRATSHRRRRKRPKSALGGRRYADILRIANDGLRDEFDSL